MNGAPYKAMPAQIGNSSGLRLEASLYRDHPQLVGAAGQVEVLSHDTLLVRLQPTTQAPAAEEPESLLEGLFLDFLSRETFRGNGPVPYTEAMAAEDEELLSGLNEEDDHRSDPQG